MSRWYLTGSFRVPVYLNGEKVKLVNISPCDLIEVCSCKPDAILSIEINDERTTARAGDLTLTP